MSLSAPARTATGFFVYRLSKVNASVTSESDTFDLPMLRYGKYPIAGLERNVCSRVESSVEESVLRRFIRQDKPST